MCWLKGTILFILYPVHCIAEGTDGLNGQTKRQRNFIGAVKMFACMEDVTELMG